jgi:hypothetical protein
MSNCIDAPEGACCGVPRDDGTCPQLRRGAGTLHLTRPMADWRQSQNPTGKAVLTGAALTAELHKANRDWRTWRIREYMRAGQPARHRNVPHPTDPHYLGPDPMGDWHGHNE